MPHAPDGDLARPLAAASPLTARLEVAGPDLARVLRQIAKTAGIGRRNVFFEFRDGRLDIGFDEVRAAIPATGHWLGVAEVSRTFIKSLVKFELEKLPVILVACHDDRIMISERSHECKWTDSSPKN